MLQNRIRPDLNENDAQQDLIARNELEKYIFDIENAIKNLDQQIVDAEQENEELEAKYSAYGQKISDIMIKLSTKKCRIQIRRSILDQREETDPAKVNELLFQFEETRRMLLQQVVQGNAQPDGTYRWKVRKEHAMGASIKE
ncbi:UNKNOWN [Stylonychia lemnae]|uniref:Uncharacterized protein n=1 Tax=Stylonychia lemnae TaxID=5949 RepID=A0A078APY6_STYLE|nr:UNKNOWN [Stylonychia lemnae]|eukprot:CDW83352.1 UNKNOWN [Stylonychia lemnae]